MDADTSRLTYYYVEVWPLGALSVLSLVPGSISAGKICGLAMCATAILLQARNSSCKSAERSTPRVQ